MNISQKLEKYKTYLAEISYLLGNDKRKLPLMVLVFISSSFVDLAGIGLLAPYVSIVLNPEGFESSKLYPYFERFGLPTTTEKVAISVGIALVLVFVIKGIFSILINRMILVFSFEKVDKLRSQLMHAYQNLSYADYLKRNSSEYIHSILTLTSNFTQGTVNSLLRLISESLVMIAIFALLLITSGFELILFITLIGIVFFFYDFFFRKKLISSGKESEIETKKLIKSINEGIHGLKEIRVLGKEEFFYNNVLNSSTKISKERVTAGLISTFPKSLFELVIVIFIVTLIITGIIFNKSITDLAVVLSVFAVAAMRLIPSTNLIIAAFTNLSHSRSAVSLLYKDLKDIETYTTVDHKRNARLSSEVFESLTLKNIDYSYGGARVGAVSNASLDLKLGETIGLMGTSGAGKSTMVDILLGFLEPEGGQVIFNNEVLTKDNIDRWLEQVAYMPQSIFLVDDTLKKNIALGIVESQIDDAKVQDAIDRSNLRELIHDLPQGVNTIIGERGVRLSGGQQQRIAIARAFYFGRNVLIMDEATSALDSKTENEIVEEIRRLKGQKAIIIIAHRLSTLRYCDRIYRLERGKIVEVGTYEEVVEKKN